MNTTSTPPASAPADPQVAPETAPRLWPGDTPWTNDDYQQFVTLYGQGNFPEIRDNPVAWDHHFIPTGDNPYRPTLIAPNDFETHLPESLRIGHGLLVIKLWEIARSKGYTKDLEEQHAEAQLQAERDATEALRQKLPAPVPNPPIDPLQQWYARAIAAAPPDSSPLQKVRCVQQAIINGQPYRSATLTEPPADPPAPEPYGPLMLPDSADALTNPLEPDLNVKRRKWNPDATTTEVIHGTARDLANLAAALVARQQVALGYAADDHTIQQLRHLTRSVRELTLLIQTTEITVRARKPGPREEPLKVDPAALANYQRMRALKRRQNSENKRLKK